VGNEEIIITRNGRKIAKLVKEADDTISVVRSLYGILAGSDLSHLSGVELKNIIRDERSKRYDRVD